MRKFTFIDEGETKEVEALSYRKAVKSYQGNSKSKQVKVEWTAKKVECMKRYNQFLWVEVKR